MLAGNPYVRFQFRSILVPELSADTTREQVRSYNESSLMSKAIGWNCLGGDTLGLDQTRNPWLPPVNCPVRSSFPSFYLLYVW